MRYCLHILKKDLHLLRWQAAGLLLVAALAVWIHGQPEYSAAEWRREMTWPVRTAALLDAFLATLWALFAVIVIHQDRLIGTDEFWMTRPIRRRAFMAGKLLFILFTVSLPFFISDVLGLLMQGFEPWRLLHGLIFRQFLFWSVILFPAIALASVTRTLAGAVAGAVLTFGAIAMVGLQQRPQPALGWASVVLSCLISAAVSIAIWAYQVKFRSERGPLVAIGSLLVCLYFLKILSQASFPQLDRKFIPGPEAAAGVFLSVPADPELKPPAGETAPSGMALFHFPVSVTGLNPGDDLNSLDSRLELRPEGMARIAAGPPVRAYLSRRLLDDEYVLAVVLPRDAVMALRGRPTSFRMRLTLGIFTPSGQSQVPADGTAHRLEHHGYCTATPAQNPSALGLSLVCRTPLAGPLHTMVRIVDSISGESSARLPLWGTRRFRSLPAEFDISLVELAYADFAGGALRSQVLAARLSAEPAKVNVILESMRPTAVFDREIVTPPLALESVAAFGN